MAALKDTVKETHSITAALMDIGVRIVTFYVPNVE